MHPLARFLATATAGARLSPSARRCWCQPDGPGPTRRWRRGRRRSPSCARWPPAAWAGGRRHPRGPAVGGEPAPASLDEIPDVVIEAVRAAVGPARIAAMAERLGITHPLEPVPSMTLGTKEVAPLELATVLATLAADGIRSDPFLVTQVEAGERMLWRTEPQRRPVLDPQIARTVTSVLEGVITGGTGTAAALGRPAAGKTGTAQEWRDAWFGGYVPQLAAVVWMGSPQGQVPMLNVGGRPVTGGSFPARVWAAFMRAATAPLPAAPFPTPDPARWPPPGIIGELTQPAPAPAPLPVPVGGQRAPAPGPSPSPPADKPGKKR